MKLIKYVFRKLSIIDYLKKRLLSDRVMKFPTFNSECHNLIIFDYDYFRYTTIGMALQRIISENIQGALAEVGVYKGDTSRFIHKISADRTFYLFDTFKGFPKNDLEIDNTEDNRFKDTSIHTVLKNIGNTNNIIVKKGYVPDTFWGLQNKTFAFALLDLDLYKPTVESLSFFYPRITKGGYLIIHDYNNSESNWACKRAVDEFMKNKPEKIIEIGDVWGTVLFRKM